MFFLDRFLGLTGLFKITRENKIGNSLIRPEILGPTTNENLFRLDIMHHIYLLLLDSKLHAAPIGDNPQRVLDIGTGTGIWAVDMAE